MEMENKLDYKFYKKKNKSSMIIYSIFSVLLLVQAITYVIGKKYLPGMVWMIIAVLYVMMTISIIKQQKNILIEPGLIINEEFIKFRTNRSLKYITINLKEIIHLEVPKYDDHIIINTLSKKYIIFLVDYDEYHRAEIKEVFKALSKGYIFNC
jgi:hypothetical protein